jgi:putative mRNA 3-end processing factor
MPMLRFNSWIAVKPAGIYCIPGQFYIDPIFPVDSAIITHGHADHARTGHQKVLATPETLAIMRVRYGEGFSLYPQALAYHERIKIQEVYVTLLPAGHILGSAQILIEYQHIRLICSGDYKRSADNTCVAFAPTACDIFITEATFALPIFKHPPIQTEVAKLLYSLAQFPERCHLIGTYALGKAQRLIAALRAAGYDRPIYLHGAMTRLCELYQHLGISLGTLENVTADNAAHLKGEIVLCPPSALHDRWSRRLPDCVVGNASGWMQIRARARQKGVELPLIISDHADWGELTQTLHDVQASEIWVTHGREEALVYYAKQNGLQAEALSLLGYEHEEE